MSRWLQWLTFAGIGATLLFLAVAVSGLAPFGHYPGPYGDRITASVLTERHVTNAVTAVMFDYRGLDTLGEEFILLTAVTGLVVLLRERRGAAGSHAIATRLRMFTPPRSPSLLLANRVLVGVTVVFSSYLISHAHLTPGGGFQGGLLLGAATLFVYLAGNYDLYRGGFKNEWLEILEGIGAGVFVMVGLFPILLGLPFLTNFLPLGQAGALGSGGTILLFNAAVALEVAAGFTLLFIEFLEETRQPRAGEEE